MGEFMKKDIDIDDFENIMLGKQHKTKIKPKSGLPDNTKKKIVVNTTFEDIPEEISSQDIDMDDFENIMLGKQPKKKIKSKSGLTDNTKKKIVVNTTFEEIKDIPKDTKIKDYKNLDMDEFENLMLGRYKTKSNKNISIKKQNNQKKEIKSVLKSIIIDGSNVLRVMYKMKEEKEKNYETEDKIIVFLYSYLKQYIVDSYDKISLYLDGRKRKINVNSHPHIQLEFSKKKTADDLIVNELHLTVTQQPTIEKEVILITNDRNLIERCKEILSNIKIISSNKFLELLGHSKDFKLFNNQ